VLSQQLRLHQPRLRAAPGQGDGPCRLRAVAGN
jgi:hypothetical protein